MWRRPVRTASLWRRRSRGRRWRDGVAHALQRLNSELDQTKRRALGLDGHLVSRLQPRTIWVASHAMNVASRRWAPCPRSAGGAWGHRQRSCGLDLRLRPPELGSLLSARRDVASEPDRRYELHAPEARRLEKDANAQAADLSKWAQKYAKDTPLDTSQITGAFRAVLDGRIRPSPGEDPDASHGRSGVEVHEPTRDGRQRDLRLLAHEGPRHGHRR